MSIISHYNYIQFVLEIKSSRPAKKQKVSPKEDVIDKTKEEENEDHFVEENTSLDTSKLLSAADLLLARHEDVQNKKIKIGVLCSGILENPEIKVTFY